MEVSCLGTYHTRVSMTCLKLSKDQRKEMCLVSLSLKLCLEFPGEAIASQNSEPLWKF